jgi:hypothetical protein
MLQVILLIRYKKIINQSKIKVFMQFFLYIIQSFRKKIIFLEILEVDKLII